MCALTNQSVLRLASGVRVEISDLQQGKEVRVSREGNHFYAGLEALTVLEFFRTPHSMAEALAEMTKRESHAAAWMKLSANIYRLFEMGALQDVDGTDVADGTLQTPLADSSVQAQVRMLHDKTRTGGFLRAIKARVKPSDVVLDIGTGTGILAIAAAKAGAKHVYAIELSGMADVAEAMIAVNGLADRITLLRGESQNIELPQKADVLVTEIIGDAPFGERVLETVSDARRRLLKPDAVMIPEGITVGLVPLRLPEELIDTYIFSPKNVGKWTADYGIDFAGAQAASAAVCGSAVKSLTTHRLRPAEYARCQALGDPAELLHIDFATFQEVTVRCSTEITIKQSGWLHGVAMYFDLEIGGGERLSTAPQGTKPLAMSEDNAWKIVTWLRLQPLEVRAGDRLQAEFVYQGGPSQLKISPVKPG